MFSFDHDLSLSIFPDGLKVRQLHVAYPRSCIAGEAVAVLSNDPGKTRRKSPFVSSPGPLYQIKLIFTTKVVKEVACFFCCDAKRFPQIEIFSFSNREYRKMYKKAVYEIKFYIESIIFSRVFFCIELQTIAKKSL